MNTAKTTSGTLQGLEEEGLLRFRGVPYATAARFAPPEPAPPWQGLRDATRHGPIAPQPPSRLRTAMGDFNRLQAEDCLTLTIATPSTEGARPVIVWLHGGAYLSGAGSLDWYDGGPLARDGNCVVVGVNYRLGALGFLRLQGVAAGNMGLLDMLAALRWVRDNIAAFGGDPSRVTVMGQSAGAHAIMLLLTMPAAEGLFHRAILQSPPPPMAPHSTAQAEEYANCIMGLLNTTPEGLRSVAVDRLLDAQGQLARSIARFADIAPPCMPVFDHLTDPAQFVAAAAEGAGARGIDLIIGTTREEMAAFFAADPGMATPDPQAVANRFNELCGDADAIELYRRRRPGGGVAELLGDLVTDHLFLFPALALAESTESRAYLYQFDWAPAGNRFAACHCIDLPFTFGTLDAWPDAAMLGGGKVYEMQQLSMAMRRAWAAFAHGRPPDAPALPWPEYRGEDRMTMVFGTVLGAVGDPAGLNWRQ